LANLIGILVTAVMLVVLVEEPARQAEPYR
jgi:hypothetical protein